MTKCQSSQEKGKGNAERLEKWCKFTPLSNVPVNQFGRAARTTICKLLGFRTSTIGTNQKLARLFSELDVRLEGKNRQVRPSNKLEKPMRDSAVLSAQLCAMAQQQEALITKLARLEYLEEHGVSI